MRGERWREIKEIKVDVGGGRCVVVDSIKNLTVTTIFQVLSSLLSLVPLEGFPLSPFEETTAPTGEQRNNQEMAVF